MDTESTNTKLINYVCLSHNTIQTTVVTASVGCRWGGAGGGDGGRGEGEGGNGMDGYVDTDVGR